MPPVGEQSDNVKNTINQYIESNKVVVFSKAGCPNCKKVQELFTDLAVPITVVPLDQIQNGNQLLAGLLEITGQEAAPFVFVNAVNIGGCDSTLKIHAENKLLTMINSEHHGYQYDLIVIGGGSGGLAASKEAARLGKKVAVCDFVKPSPQGTSWGVGGTCVNVGCIPKKMMHHAALVAHDMEGVENYGWTVQEKMNHDWTMMKDNIQDHIGSLNWSYRVQLREATVDYHNAYAVFTGPHTVKTTNKRGKVQDLTAQYFLLAMGGRPRYPDLPGLQELCITSDDIFSLPHSPGKTLVIGASYIALECGGFLAGMGLDVTIMVRSILLRGFDQQIAEKIGEYMSGHQVKFIRGAVPTKIERIEEGSPGKLRVSGRTNDGQEIVDEYNTVLVATGRDPCTSDMGLEAAGVEVNAKTGYISVTDGEQTNVPHIYAVGDILEGKMELTPLAIQAGKLLAKRLFAGAKTMCDYVNVPTTVFTPLEYGAIGYSEEDAIAKYGEDSIEVYHSNYQPYEWIIPKHDATSCYAKLICLIPENERVIGFHFLGPNAGEVTQGFCVAMKVGARKEHFDMTIGIHPTSAEMITNLAITKRSGKPIEGVGCTG